MQLIFNFVANETRWCRQIACGPTNCVQALRRGKTFGYCFWSWEDNSPRIKV